MENNSKNLTREQRFFLDVLKDFIYGYESRNEFSGDWDKIVEYAKNHQLLPIFFKQTKLSTLQTYYISQIYRYVNIRSNVEKLDTILDKCPHVYVKGIEIAKIYPVPELRTMGDVDVLVQKKDIDDIYKLLSNAGWEYLGEEKGESKYSINGYMFEFHDTLIHRYEGKEALIEYYSKIWDYIQDGELDWTFHLLYLFEHLRQHFIGEGVGFRQFLDIAIVTKRCNIDWEQLQKRLMDTGLFEFAKTVAALCYEWFGTDSPLNTKKLEKDFYVESTQRIFENGVFGFENKENVASRVGFQMYYQKIDFKSARRNYVFRTAFPKYEIMRELPYCQYLKKSKVLLPMAWIHRIIYRLCDKNSVSLICRNIDYKKVEKRTTLFKEWGL